MKTINLMIMHTIQAGSIVFKSVWVGGGGGRLIRKIFTSKKKKMCVGGGGDVVH